ncbi:hypothetical protein GOODEAATRI_029804, partial [Goodea atripinnis]
SYGDGTINSNRSDDTKHTSVAGSEETLQNSENRIPLQVRTPKPLTPCPNSWESMAVYEQHIRMAQEYQEVQSEIAYLLNRKEELTVELELEQKEQQTSLRLMQEHSKLLEDHSSLLTVCQDLRSKLSLTQSQNQPYS